MSVRGEGILINGGSSGVGFAVARAFLAKDAKVVVTGRRTDALAKLVEELRRRGPTVWSAAVDVATGRGADPDRFAARSVSGQADKAAWTSVRMTGSASSTNHGLRFIQPTLRQLGCGSGI